MYIFIGVGSSAALVLFMSLTVLLCACACCYFKKKMIINASGDKPQDNAAPIYEDVPPERMNCQEADIDFQTNVAYSTVKTIPYKI